jgi:hypothetical protein
MRATPFYSTVETSILLNLLMDTTICGTCDCPYVPFDGQREHVAGAEGTARRDAGGHRVALADSGYVFNFYLGSDCTA